MSVVSCLMPRFNWDRAAEGLLGAGQRLAKQLDVQHVVLIAGNVDETVAQHVADRADSVVIAQHADLNDYQPELCLATFHAACVDLNPQVILLGTDTYSQELAPRLAHRLGGCSIGDVRSMEVVDKILRVTRSVYGGKASAVYAMRWSPAVVWLRAHVFEPAVPMQSAAQVERRQIDPAASVSEQLSATAIVQQHVESSGETRLEDAQVIVSGGRGLGGPEPFDELRQLASVMRAQVGASRAACDAGWVSHSMQVGQTGKKVAPDLYLAIAISGASQHMMGIADAKVIAAINTDQDAPIFRNCQFGLVEDYRKVIGRLRERIVELMT